jgi:hypothetical protein
MSWSWQLEIDSERFFEMEDHARQGALGAFTARIVKLLNGRAAHV